MRFRARLLLQLLLTFLALAFFMFVASVSFWNKYGVYLPVTIPVADAYLSTYMVLAAYGVLLLLLTALALFLVYLLVDRLFIAPINEISKSMSTFTKSSKFTPLGPIALSTKEIRDLVTSYIGFTKSVEEVHERDIEISRVKSDFISTAAHQLRTPLTGIRWALEALAKQPLTEQQMMLVNDAANKGHDLVAIVGTLLDISSIESGKHKYVFTEGALEELVASVVHDFQYQADERGVHLIFEAYNGTLPHVRFDREQIKWVLNNLIENAIRYTPTGGKVTITMHMAADRVQALVRDTGIGITTKDKNSIFERFYRAENAIAKENKGNGLGLYISRTIASDHSGDLNFSANENGLGTTFTLSLPRVHS